MKVLEERKTTKTGAARYKAGVLKYAQMGYWNPDYQPADTDVLVGGTTRGATVGVSVDGTAATTVGTSVTVAVPTSCPTGPPSPASPSSGSSTPGSPLPPMTPAPQGQPNDPHGLILLCREGGDGSPSLLSRRFRRL